MFGRKLQFVLASLAACSALAGSAPECDAQCNCFSRPAIAAPVAPITSYRPVFAAAAPVAAQTVNYMPYTAYRTVYTNMPVTTYQPAAVCGPCGGATTVMRPVTTYALRPQLVPYTTYRPVVTSVVAAYAPVAPACSPCGGAVAVPLVPSQMAASAVSPFAPPIASPSAGYTAVPPPAAYVPPGMPVSPGVPGSTVPSLGLPNIDVPPSLNAAPGQPIAPVPQSNTTFLPPAGSVIIGPPSATYTAPPGTTYSTPSPYSSPSGPPAANSPGTTFSNQPAAGATNGSTTNGSATPGAAGAGSAATGNPSGGGNPSGSGAPESRLRLRVIPDIAPPPSGFKPEAAPGANGPAGVGNPAGSPDDTSPKSKDSGVEGQKTNLQPPRLMDPQDRVTARPIRQTLVYKPVSADPVLQAGASETAPLDDSGWRAAK